MNQTVTKNTLNRILIAWGMGGSVPRKGQKVTIAFPPDREYRVAEITWTDKMDTTGKFRLYQIEFSHPTAAP